MEPVLLVRREFISKYELRIAQKFFRVETQRVTCKNCLVIGRYSILPFYEELATDLVLNGSHLVHTPEQHRWIANFDYYPEVQAFTPETWTEEQFPTCPHPGPFVVKGRLKSKKFQWKRQMFARTKHQAWQIAERLKEDSFLGEQGILFRRYIPLRTYEIGPQGLPYTNEWRFFYWGERRLSYGYYWSNSDSFRKATIAAEAFELADEIARRVARFAQFFVLDLAETASGEWILIEINDAQMSELSENDPEELYSNLRSVSDAGG